MYYANYFDSLGMKSKSSRRVVRPVSIVTRIEKKVSTFDKLVSYRTSIGSKESIPQSMKYRYFIFDF